MTNNPGIATDDTDSNEHGAQLVKRLFDRFDVPKRSRSRKVEAVLGVSYAAAHRRVMGDLPLTVAEIERLAAHFGLTLADIVMAEFVDGAAEATLTLGPLSLPCRAWIGEASDPAKPGSVVAVRKGAEWLLIPPTQLAGEPSYVVKTFLCNPLVAHHRPRVAVLDDTAETVDAVANYLRAAGFEAEAFGNAADLSAAMKEKPFDAYIIDWLLDRTTAADLLNSIRASDALCPIAVLTGKVREGKANPLEVAAVVDGLDAEFYEKPAQMQIIAGKIKKMLAARAQKLPRHLPPVE